MEAFMNFRSAINGFKREDVVKYIEYITAKHTAQVNQLNSEIEYLKGKSVPQEAPAPAPVTDEEKEALMAQIIQLEDRCAALEQELKAAREEKPAVAAPQVPSVEQELEAYRRAERTERLARERAELVERVANDNAIRTEKMAQERAQRLTEQATGALADATVKVDAAAAEVSALADSVLAQLTQLQSAVTAGRQTLKDAAASMYAINPDREN